MKKLKMTLFSMVYIVCFNANAVTYFENVDNIEEVKMKSSLEHNYKYYIACEIPEENYAHKIFTNNYELKKNTVILKNLKNDSDDSIRNYEYMNSSCIIKPNIALGLDIFSKEEKEEFKDLMKETGKTYKMHCRKIGDRDNFSTFKIKYHIFDGDNIAFAEKENNAYYIYKILKANCLKSEIIN